MPNENAIVGRIVRVERDERGHTVELQGGRRARLDATRENAALARVLEGLGARRRPVYLEVDPAGDTVRRVLLPVVSRVEAVRALDDGGLEVRLEVAQARLAIRRDAPDAAEMERLVLDAEQTGRVLLVTADEAQNVVDVRVFTPDPEGPVPPFPGDAEPPPRVPWALEPLRWLVDFLRDLWYWLWPWRWWRGCISKARAQQVFDAMAATTCDPLTVPPPCIPFLYPDDGCWARAHEMCRLMLGMHLTPRKVWIDGSLHTPTKNNPSCFVNWGWHVAPTLCVRGPGFFRRRRMVIDPALFTAPVTEATWKSVQGDPNATLTDTDWTQFWHGGGPDDAAYTNTNYYLDVYRDALQLRAAQQGTPPYANCP
ncbi:hypothetical protein J421_0544 [Gemmatirosa kalamazoonensis]|uniref:Protein glutaminase domain-containing protein n=1 Tax=Gemmatirosa kalamazoonensis TaxID=861299 RepID=W0RBA7_9BACT|nr:protein-glutamine glutaminase family protein [Gemmatirosa kalamazoonensis]AHG88081.1 hypothetical protein J421_0544 [Gemmatirosa kalamazoonensis]